MDVLRNGMGWWEKTATTSLGVAAGNLGIKDRHHWSEEGQMPFDTL